MFVLQKIHVPVVLFVLAGLLFWGATAFPAAGAYLGDGALIALAAGVAFLLAVALWGWLAYTNYEFIVGDDAFRVMWGILSKSERAIPYRQIQDIAIRRDISARAFGVSTVVILTAGHDEDPGERGTSGGDMDVVDKDVAEAIQATLLARMGRGTDEGEDGRPQAGS